VIEAVPIFDSGTTSSFETKTVISFDLRTWLRSLSRVSLEVAFGRRSHVARIVNHGFRSRRKRQCGVTVQGAAG
jgi:hypothetical protein